MFPNLSRVVSLGTDKGVNLLGGILFKDEKEDPSCYGITWEVNGDHKTENIEKVIVSEISDEKISFSRTYNAVWPPIKFELNHRVEGNVWEGFWSMSNEKTKESGVLRCLVTEVSQDFFMSMSTPDALALTEPQLNYSYDEFISLTSENQQQLSAFAAWVYAPLIEKFFKDHPRLNWIAITTNPFNILQRGLNFSSPNKKGIEEMAREENKAVYLITKK